VRAGAARLAGAAERGRLLICLWVCLYSLKCWAWGVRGWGGVARGPLLALRNDERFCGIRRVLLEGGLVSSFLEYRYDPLAGESERAV